MFFSLFNFLSFRFLIPLLESLFNLWKRQKRNGWSVFYAIKRHTHTHAAVWSKICWSICGKKVSDWRRRSTSAVAQDALKFKVRSTQSDGGSVDARRPTSPPSALLISANLTVFYVRKISRIHQFSLFSTELKGFFGKNQTHSGVKVFKAFTRRRADDTTMWIICSKLHSVKNGLLRLNIRVTNRLMNRSVR